MGGASLRKTVYRGGGRKIYFIVHFCFIYEHVALRTNWCGTPKIVAGVEGGGVSEQKKKRLSFCLLQFLGFIKTYWTFMRKLDLDFFALSNTRVFFFFFIYQGE